ncbi:MAG: efflux RND transporter permease subunit, partial [Acidobacteriota bacterium]|nr:efflux RND transporter permease subunit [Acidobacteriota bacterium]
MKGLIAWFARNGVVANLLMITVVMAGAITLPGLKKEVFPEFAVGVISVSVSYRGAAPEEVEEAVCIRVEEALQGLEGIERILSTANEGMGSVRIEIESGYDPRALLDEVKARVDAIDTFPEETEQPVIEEARIRNQVIFVSISGDADELTLKRLGEQVRDELLLLPELSQVELRNARLYEISIEVSEEDLRRHGLTFDQVATAVRQRSLDLPGGSVKAESGEILLRTKGQAYRGEEFARLTLITRPDGSRLQLDDVARVVDGFEDADKFSWLDGKPSVMVQTFRVGDESALEVARAVKE